MDTAKCRKFENWNISFIFTICFLIGVTFFWGATIVYRSGLPILFAFTALIIFNVFMAFFTTCRHCYFYGKRCYAALGLLVPHFFKRDPRPTSTVREGLWLCIFAANILFPPALLIFRSGLSGQVVLHAAAYLIPPVTVGFLVGRYACPRCKNTGCAVNPDRAVVSPAESAE